MPQLRSIDAGQPALPHAAEIGAGAPDPAKCRARAVLYEPDVSWCLVEPHPRCPYSETYGFKFLCFHPQRDRIVARTLEQTSPLRKR